MASFIRISENSIPFAALLRSLCVAGLTLTVASVAQARIETLRWSHATPPEASGFRVHVGSASGTYTQQIDVGLPVANADGDLSYNLEVADDATIYVAVSAYNSAGDSPLSNERMREPGSPPPVQQSGGDALLTDDFQTSATGQYVPGWVDTGANNSMVRDDSLFQVADLGGNRVFGTSSTHTNIHSHYVSGGSAGWSAYEFRGRMLITDPNAGIGVTVHSQYPNADTYYRIMRWQNTDFYMEARPYPTPLACESSRTGTVPQVDRWYRFRFEVVPNQSSTSIRAKVWQDGTLEPATWQVRCEDGLLDGPGFLFPIRFR